MIIRLVSLLSILPLQAQGAIVLDDTPRTLRGLTTENSILFDFDGNGRSDWFIQSIFLTGGGIYQIQIFRFYETEFLYEFNPISMYGTDYHPLAAGSIIGPDSETTELRYGIPAAGSRGPFVTGLPATFNHPGQGNFVGVTAYLGFRFEGDEGTHYGYVLFTDTTDQGTTLLATAWESEPGKAIIAGAIPEPSAALLGLLGSFLLFRRKITFSAPRPRPFTPRS